MFDLFEREVSFLTDLNAFVFCHFYKIPSVFKLCGNGEGKTFVFLVKRNEKVIFLVNNANANDVLPKNSFFGGEQTCLFDFLCGDVVVIAEKKQIKYEDDEAKTAENIKENCRIAVNDGGKR